VEPLTVVVMTFTDVVSTGGDGGVVVVGFGSGDCVVAVVAVGRTV